MAYFAAKAKCEASAGLSVEGHVHREAGSMGLGSATTAEASQAAAKPKAARKALAKPVKEVQDEAESPLVVPQVSPGHADACLNLSDHTCSHDTCVCRMARASATAV